MIDGRSRIHSSNFSSWIAVFIWKKMSAMKNMFTIVSVYSSPIRRISSCARPIPDSDSEC